MSDNSFRQSDGPIPIGVAADRVIARLLRKNGLKIVQRSDSSTLLVPDEGGKR